MKHEATSLNTKKAFAQALKQLLEQKPCSKITVSDLVRACGVNRKTFYYHFMDLPDLVQWMFEQEAVEVVRQFDLTGDLRQAIRFVIGYVDENAHFINCIYDSVGHDGMKQFLYQDFIGITRTILDGAAAQVQGEVPERFLNFASRFYAGAIANTLIDWFQNREELSKEEVTDSLVLMLSGALPVLMQEKAAQPAGGQ